MSTEEGEVYIRADGKKVRRVKRQAPQRSMSSPGDAGLASFLSGNANKPNPNLSRLKGSMSVAGDGQGEIYIRADGKKVRRVRKSVAASSSSSVAASPIEESGESENKKSLSGFLDSRAPTRTKVGGSASVAGDQIAVSKNSSLTGEVYVRADGKKVRRVRKSDIAGEDVEIITKPDGTKVRRIRRPKPSEGADQQQTAKSQSQSSGLGGFLDRGSTDKPKTSYGSQSVGGDMMRASIATTSGEGEVYIRSDGKKVRRVRKVRPSTDGNAVGGSLSGFLDSNTSSKPDTSGAATVSGALAASDNQESEIYVRPDGTKVRRIRRPKPSADQSEKAESSSPTKEKKTLGGFLEKGSSSRPLRIGGSASVAGDQIAVDKNSSLTGEVYIRADGKKVRRIKKKAASSANPGDTVEIITRPDGTKVRRIRRGKPKSAGDKDGAGDKAAGGVGLLGFLESQPKDKMAAGAATVTGEMATSSGSSKPLVAQSLPVKLPTDAQGPSKTESSETSTGEGNESSKTEEKKSLTSFLSKADSGQPRKLGGSASVAGDQIAVNKSSSLTGEVYIRADGKKVRRVKRQSTVQPGDEVEIITKPDGTKVRRIRRAKKPEGTPEKGLGSFLDSDATQKPIGSGGATVGGDRLIGSDEKGDIYIRADGKKVRRVRKSVSGAAVDSDKYEIITKPDGTKVRRIRRSTLEASKAENGGASGGATPSLGSMLSKDEQAAAKLGSSATVAGDDMTGRSSALPGGSATDSSPLAALLEASKDEEKKADAAATVAGDDVAGKAAISAAVDPTKPIPEGGNAGDESGATASPEAVSAEGDQAAAEAASGVPPTAEGGDQQQASTVTDESSPHPVTGGTEGTSTGVSSSSDAQPIEGAQKVVQMEPGMVMVPADKVGLLEEGKMPDGMKLVSADQQTVPEGMVLVSKEQAARTIPEGMVAVPKTAGVDGAPPEGFVLVPKDKVQGDVTEDLVLVPRSKVKEDSDSNPKIVFMMPDGEEAKDSEADKESRKDVDISGANIVSMDELQGRVEMLKGEGRSKSPPRFLLQPLPADASLRDDFIKKNLLPSQPPPAEEAPPPAPVKPAEPSQSIAQLLAQMSTMENFDAEKMGDLLERLEQAEKRRKKLEKQLQQAGVAIAEDIDYETCMRKVSEIGKRMNEIGGSDVTHPDKEEQNRLREEYFKLEQDMEKYNSALMLTDEYQAEQERIAKKWEDDNRPGNVEALKKLRRHMPVEVRNMSEAMLTNEPSPNGKYLPKATAKKFKRTNVLQLIRRDPEDIIRMHPSTLENLRVTGLTLTERRALYEHLRPAGPKWEAQKAEKMTERKWVWYNMMKGNFKESLASWQRHVDQYGPPGAHPYATRANPNEGCPLIGKQCPLKADKLIDYDGDYGYTSDAEYEVSEVKKADADDPGAKAMQEALELMREKKANERSDALKKHYKGKLLQVSKANGSCESMDEAMDKMEFGMVKWIGDIVDMGDDKSKLTEDVKKKEVANFVDVLSDVKLLVINFCERSGMQLSGKKKDGEDSPDIRSAVECSLAEEVCEAFEIFSKFVTKRLKDIEIIDTRVKSTIDMLKGNLNELSERNKRTLKNLEAERSSKSRKLKTAEEIESEAKAKLKESEPPPEAADESMGAGPPLPGPPRGGLMDAIKGGRGGRGGLMDAIKGGRGGGGRGGLMDAIKGGRGGGGRGGLMDAIKAGRGGGDDGGGGGRGGLLAAIQGRGGGGPPGGDGGGRGGLLAAIQGRGRGGPPGGDGGGRGGLLAAIQGRGRGGPPAGGGRGGLLAAIQARGGGGVD